MERSRVRRWRKQLRQAYVRLLRSPGAPREVARGVGLGLFIAMLPIVQLPVALGIAEALRRFFRYPVSRVGAAAGVWVTNPLTGPFFYGLAFLVGRPIARVLLPDSHLSAPGTELSFMSLSSAGPFALEVILGLALGGVLIGVPLAFVGYRITLALVERYQLRRATRRERSLTMRPQQVVA